jgi:Holliday junction DNA helicase RuvA
MIARLAGTVADIRGDQLVIDVNGVGYAVGVPLRNAEGLTEGDAITVWVYTAVREDAITLYGFLTREEKSVFELLISVSQVGPRLGLNALSSITGVGKKTAERIVLELRGKMTVAPAGAPSGIATPARVADDGFAIALAQLGYKRTEIDLAIDRLRAEGLLERPLGERITAALRVLTSGSGYARPPERA